ncbi:probable G-protein coupled receptor CG31760 [Pollicipes pollicipes]|uniref:probable G-protein coupled receptor CG31760 n=1 Tax=Pollicipes pollicipes TaxID=41117 RepID=UPI00188580EA|nr:probable G-protein coupled receptor CG31760 [Pollicipes pollicipes]
MRRQPELLERGIWTYPYFCCRRKRWLLSYTVRVPPHPLQSTPRTSRFISFDVDVSALDINQCDLADGESVTSDSAQHVNTFRGSHKCHETTTCSFTPGRGWVRGGYVCRCRAGFYASRGNPTFDGTNVEGKYRGRCGWSCWALAEKVTAFVDAGVLQEGCMLPGALRC